MTSFIRGPHCCYNHSHSIMETNRRVEKTFMEAGPDHRPAGFAYCGPRPYRSRIRALELISKSIIGPDGLKKNGRAAGRHQDQADLRNPRMNRNLARLYAGSGL